MQLAALFAALAAATAAEAKVTGTFAETEIDMEENGGIGRLKVTEIQMTFEEDIYLRKAKCPKATDGSDMEDGNQRIAIAVPFTPTNTNQKLVDYQLDSGCYQNFLLAGTKFNAGDNPSSYNCPSIESLDSHWFLGGDPGNAYPGWQNRDDYQLDPDNGRFPNLAFSPSILCAYKISETVRNV